MVRAPGVNDLCTSSRTMEVSTDPHFGVSVPCPVHFMLNIPWTCQSTAIQQTITSKFYWRHLQRSHTSCTAGQPSGTCNGFLPDGPRTENPSHHEGNDDQVLQEHPSNSTYSLCMHQPCLSAPKPGEVLGFLSHLSASFETHHMKVSQLTVDNLENRERSQSHDGSLSERTMIKLLVSCIIISC